MKFIQELKQARKLQKGIINAIFIDSGEITEINKNDLTFTRGNKEYVINADKIYENIIYYITDNAEPLEISEKNTALKISCNSTKFRDIYNQKVVKQMLMTEEKDRIEKILYLVVGCIVLSLINIYLSYDIFNMVNWLIDINL